MRRPIGIIMAWSLLFSAGAMLLSCRPSTTRLLDASPAIQETHSAGDTLRLAFVGDLLLDRGVRKVIERKGIDVLFSSGVDSVFRSCDIVVANLECPATTIHSPIHKRFIFRADPEWLPALRRHGITHLNMANNHVMDQGREGLTDTKRNIEQAGMIPLGAGNDSDEACGPYLLTDHPCPVYLYTSLQVMSENWPYLPDRPCVCEHTVDTLAARVRALRAEQPEAFVIVMLHWGAEHRTTPATLQRVQARRLIDAGADCLIGHHTHTAQPVEYYKGKPVCYGIGNFIFDQTAYMNRRALLIRLDIGRRHVAFAAHPLFIERCRSSLAGDAEEWERRYP